MSIKNLKDYVDKGLFYEAVVEDGSDIIFIVDYSGCILYHNPSVKETLDYAPRSLVGKVFYDFIKPDGVEDFKKAFEKSSNQPYDESIEFEFLCRDGSYRYLEFNSINLKHKSGVEGLILDCRDITQRKRDSEELLQAQKAKEQFLANMSHEIRTPVNGISGILNLLSESTDPEEQKSYLNAIKNSTESLKVIINDILDLSAIESGKLRFEKIGFSLDYQLTAVLDTFLYQSKEKGIDLVYKISDAAKEVFLGDPARLNQILINLVSNAIKFTHKGKISIKIDAEKQDDNTKCVRFEVKDTGVGIPKDKINHIFDSFTQADTSVTRRYGGTGLGLTIVNELIELQNGTIQVESEEGVGTLFTFSIPYELGTESDLIYPKPADFTQILDYNLKDIKVLLVEDNEVNRLYATGILNKWNCEVTAAENGSIAYQMVNDHAYDIILMDVQMPVLDGYEATRKIRKINDEKASQTPIIALTANAIKSDVEKCRAAGMSDYISKPFHPETLFQIISKHVDSVSQQQQASGKKTINISSPHPEEKNIDLSYLTGMSNGDTGFIKNMIEVFITNTPAIIDDMQSYARQSDWTMVAKMAHKLKPSVTFIGIHSAKSVVLDLERFASEQINIEKIPTMVDQVAEICEKVYLELELVAV